MLTRTDRNTENDELQNLSKKKMYFSKLYPETTKRVPNYLYEPVRFDNCESHFGIPALASHFKNFGLGKDHLMPRSPDNNTKIDNRSEALKFVEMRYVYRYLKHSTFVNPNIILRTTTYDHVVYGIFAFMLKWSTATLLRFGPDFRGITELITQLIADSTRSHIVTYRNEPVDPKIFRILRCHFKCDFVVSPNSFLH